MKGNPAPFSCQYSPEFPQLLHKLRCTLAISTYQAGKIIFISAENEHSVVQLPRSFHAPMGIALNGNHLAVAAKQEVNLFTNAQQLAAGYPKQPNTYDALFLPRGAYYTGEADIHDLAWRDHELFAVATRFSCIARLSHDFSFEPVWKPPFVTDIAPDDRCHLNGLAFDNQQPKFATALGASNDPDGWRKYKANGGVIIDIPTNTIICDGLPMPHSPRIYPEGFFALLSGTGELIQIHTNKKVERVAQLPGFARGMDRIGNFLFIGISKVRTMSRGFNELPVAGMKQTCGIVVLDINTKKVVAQLEYESSVEEIFDVKILPGMRRPGILTKEKNGHVIAITTPQSGFWAELKTDV